MVCTPVALGSYFRKHCFGIWCTTASQSYPRIANQVGDFSVSANQGLVVSCCDRIRAWWYLQFACICSLPHLCFQARGCSEVCVKTGGVALRHRWNGPTIWMVPRDFCLYSILPNLCSSYMTIVQIIASGTSSRQLVLMSELCARVPVQYKHQRMFIFYQTLSSFYRYPTIHLHLFDFYCWGSLWVFWRNSNKSQLFLCRDSLHKLLKCLCQIAILVCDF